jgi:hypothetical protein
MAQELLPDGLNLSRDTHDLIVSFAHEFVHMVTFQANEICQKETRNGYIGLQHVIRACEELGFPDYVDEIEEVSEIYDRQLKLMQKVCVDWYSGMVMLMVEKGAEDWMVG